MKYSLFYNYNTIGDVLLIIFDNQTIPSKLVKHDDVVVLYHDERIVGINIFNISQVIKIKSNGLIVLPANVMIDVINDKLAAYSLPKLDYVQESGFKIGQVLTCIEHEESDHLHVLTVDVKDCVLDIVCGAPNVKAGQKVVVATPGTTMFDGQKIIPSSLRGIASNGMLCSMKELHLLDAPAERGILVLPESANIGDDFFKIQGGQING